MTITARQAAKTICKHGGWNVTNLELQKTLYLINMVYMGKNDEPLIEENFEAWRFGPVVRSLYNDVKFFGADPIPDIFINEEFEDESTPKGKFLKDGCEHLLKKSSGELVGLTHRDGGAWIETPRNGIIDGEKIKREFKEFYA